MIVLLELKQYFDRLLETSGKTQRQRQAGNVSSLLDGNNTLAGYADHFRESILRHPVLLPALLDLIDDCLRHIAPHHVKLTLQIYKSRHEKSSELYTMPAFF